MPDDALPRPWGKPTNVAHYERAYKDPIGRAFTGYVTIKPIDLTEADDVVAAPAKVELVGGLLSVDLVPGTYELVASLMTVEQHRVKQTTQITVSAN